MRTTIRRHVSAAERRLDEYEVAYLAGGPQRVLETALFALRDRGTVTVAGPRVRAVEDTGGPAGHPARHPVERAVLASCPRGRSLAVVAKTVRGGPEVTEIERGLAALGLITRARHRLTRAGRSRLKAAREEGTLPAYVFDGPGAHRDRRLRRAVAGTAVPAGLGRSLIRMGRAADPDHVHDYGSEDGGDPDSASGTHSSSQPGGFSCGSGGGGGGGSD
ncbi:TIGR04222 domain-containing membrane protein [Streptomyces sp. NBC_00838]|uniref:TIGR04222 domain-containing membrane protein n=1 Tax=Streptomyces sp. NBC_00838 TaxID=2903680 RepID=UPI00386D4672|nr:TIGR04222 domain-containing membrane protein [Streptomyces sp. NBC_00838]